MKKEIKLIVKVHNAQHKKLISIVDSDILGKKIEQGKLQLDLTSDFYKGEEMSEEKLKDLAPTAYILNITGKHSIAFAEKAGIIDKHTRIIVIADIPHAEILFEG